MHVCGADSLAGDPLGGLALTTRAVAFGASLAAGLRKPTLLLGGGCYAPEDTARAWTVATFAAVGAHAPCSLPGRAR